MAELIIRSGKHQGKKLVVADAEVVIGRDESCRIRLASTEVSRRHCAIKLTDEGLRVRDLGSGNGTLVNDVAIEEETLLQPGDLIRVGPLELQVPGKRQAVRRDPPESSIFSEDDIAHWLSDEETPQSRASRGDTTIIRMDRVAPAAPAAKKQFRSIAEEAADIIRRHWETQEEEEV